MKKVLIIFGTRPEAIKMAPLVHEFLKYPLKYETKVCVTAQHRQMLDQVLDFFTIEPDFDLNLMKPGQNLYTLTSDLILGLRPVLEEFKPDFIFVHGDTTTSTAAALTGFYSNSKICHVEAGLRTFNKQSPFPEEMNRQLTGRLADYHFAPTSTAKTNLKKENVEEKNILVTGNTVIDSLFWANNKLDNYQDAELRLVDQKIRPNKKLILVTGHRRENFGQAFINICNAIQKIALMNDVDVIYPVHLNPNVQDPVYEILSNIPNVHLIAPLGYPAFMYLMKKSYIILTDSGGVQEEAPSLGKPVLVMRETTERPEAIEAGTVVLVGTDENKIISNVQNLLDNIEEYEKMARSHNPYGDGMACKRIENFISNL